MKTTTAADHTTFGDRLIFSSDKNIDYHVSDDKRAFDIKFDTPPAAAVGNVSFAGVAQTSAPITTRSYSVVIPAAGKKINTTFFVNGFGSSEPGTSTLLMLSVNGRQRVTRFAPDADGRDFVAALPVKTSTRGDVRLNVTLLAERDASHPDASALIAINDITADSLLTPQKASRRRALRTRKK